MTSGNGLSLTYTASNKAKTITRGTTSIAFDHDPELQRYAQTGPGGLTLYLSAMGVLAERFGGLGGPVRWTNYLMAGGRLIGIHVENFDETTLTRYFHRDHLGSIAVITNEVGAVVERLAPPTPQLTRRPHLSTSNVGAASTTRWPAEQPAPSRHANDHAQEACLLASTEEPATGCSDRRRTHPA